MKNYTMDYKTSKDFITGYKIEENIIKIKKGSGNTVIIPYTKENEEQVIAKMENQVRNMEETKIKFKDVFLSTALPLSLPFAIHGYVNLDSWVSCIALATLAVGSLCFPANLIMDINKNKDIKKLNYFLVHKEELSENLEKIEDLEKYFSKEKIEQMKKDDNAININNIDNYTLKDLKELRKKLEEIKKKEDKDKKLIKALK